MPVRATPAKDSAQRSNNRSEMASLTLRRYQRCLGQDGGEYFINGAHETRVEGPKLGV